MPISRANSRVMRPRPALAMSLAGWKWSCTTATRSTSQTFWAPICSRMILPAGGMVRSWPIAKSILASSRSPGWTESRRLARARIFSLIVMPIAVSPQGLPPMGSADLQHPGDPSAVSASPLLGRAPQAALPPVLGASLHLGHLVGASLAAPSPSIPQILDHRVAGLRGAERAAHVAGALTAPQRRRDRVLDPLRSLAEAEVLDHHSPAQNRPHRVHDPLPRQARGTPVDGLEEPPSAL